MSAPRVHVRGAARPTLSIVVPAHDEGEGIEWAVGSLRSGVQHAIDLDLLGRGEVIVVDDHSTDDTGQRGRGLAPSASVETRVVPVTGPQGLGSGVRTGLQAAKGDLVLYTDADLPFDPVDLPRLLRPVDQYRADLVCGYRIDRTSEGLWRTVQSHAYNGLTRLVLPVKVRDVNFAAKLVRREVVDALLPDLGSTGSFIDAELLSRAALHGFHVVQIGLDYFPRHGSASTLGGWPAVTGIVRDYRALGSQLRRS
jgi:glycosyltransferase involved in cell wall biosynthesis